MMKLYGILRTIVISTILLLVHEVSFSQCPTVFDFFGNPSNNEPYWYSCTGSNFSFNLQSPNNWGAYSINWGDGSPIQSGTSWNSPQIINHLYTAAVDTFVVTITETATGCQIQGVVVMEEATSASIQIPIGGLTQACAPQVMEFINSSTNVSETTMFEWDFGDGSAPLVFDHTNWQQTISHLYDVGTVDCETIVRLTAENYCNTIQGGESEATFNPIRIWDLDDPGISASATLLCYPDTTVTFTNTTERNCLFQGNIYQRYEYWNFGDYWNLGHDSIIDWTPWPPTFPKTMHYPGIGTYTVQLLDSNFCGIAPTSITIQIVPPPVAGLTASQDTICQGQSVTFFQQSTGGNAYQWNFGVNNNWINTGSGNITYVFNQAGTFTVSTRVSISGATGGCSDTESVTIVVLPRPTVNILKSPSEGCGELTVQYTATTSPGVTSWAWTFDVPPSTSNLQTPLPVYYNTPGPHPVSLTVTNSNGCSNSDNDQIIVRPIPVAGIAVTNLCEGEIAQFTSTSTSAPGSPITSYIWNFGDGFSSSMQNPTHEYTTTGDFTVSLIVATAFCSDTTTTVVSVQPKPHVIIGQDVLSGCSPLQVSFSNNSIDAVNYQWNLGNGTFSTEIAPTATYFNISNQDSTFQAILTASNAFGCSTTDTLYVLVHAGALADFNDGNTPPGCSPHAITFNNTSLNASSYLWDLGDGTTTAVFSPTHLFENNTGFIQTFNVNLIAYSPFGCHDTTSRAVTVYPLADFSFDLSGYTGCSPLTVTMPLISGAQAYEWNFGNGITSNSPIPIQTFNNFTTQPIEYSVTLIGTSAFGCVDTATSVITVNPGPISQFSMDETAGCSPHAVELTNISINGTTFSWEYGDGLGSYTTDTTHTHIYTNNTDEVVTYETVLTAISPQGCLHTFELPIQVYPTLEASFTIPAAVCSPVTVNPVNTSTNANSYNWSFGNGVISNLTNPSVYYPIGDGEVVNYTISLEATSNYGCQDSTQAIIEVHPNPIASFTLNESAACEPAPMFISNQSVQAVNYIWNYGDGSSSLNADSIHSYVFSAAGNNLEIFNVTLTAFNAIGCSDTTSQQFTLYPQVISAFSADTANCAPFTTPFTNESIGGDSYLWSFGDGSVSSLVSPTHSFNTNNTDDLIYQVNLITYNLYGCSDTSSLNIHVYHKPIANLVIDSLFGCYPQSVQFANQSIGADSYYWVYGTGETSTNADSLHTQVFYNFDNQLANYTVSLTAITENGCTDTDQAVVQVSPELNADFTIQGQGCSPLQVYFDNNTDGGWTYQWNFGDGDISSEFEPVHTFFNWTDQDTIYNVLLVVQNQFGCVDTADAFVSVYPIPQVSFNATPEEQTWPNATVTLDNTSIGGNLNWEWRMDDGTELNIQEPASYTYGDWGTYQIRLIGANNFCSDTAYRTITINPPVPIANFTGPASGCAPLTVQFNNLSQYAAISNWQFGDGGQANATNPVYTYYQPGTYTVTLFVTGYDGSQDFMVQEQIIQVYPNAQAAFTVTPNEVSVPSQPVYCLNLSSNANYYEWQFGDEQTSNEINPIHYYQEEGIYSITLIANNQYNCPDTMHVVDAVYARVGGEISFPNAFTPVATGGNGGAYNPNSFDNDIFFPLHSGVSEYHLLIYNKWGELLFESNDVNRGWDGYYRGILCKQDVYVWKVRARFVDGQRFEQAGDVTLLIR